MAKEICISSTPHETRLAILEDDQLAEIYYERENEYTLAGSIYNGRVTRVLPGMQSAFVDVGLERDAFLYVTDFLELEDQEETDELEKAAASGSNQPPREVHHSADRKEGRGDDRGQRSSQKPEQRQDQPGRDRRPTVEITSETGETEFAAPASFETGEQASGDQESTGEPGAKRWRGRRRRRGGRSATDAPDSRPETAESAETHPAASPQPEVEQTHEIRASASMPPAPRGSSVPAPFVLPGESLSKYGGSPAEDAQKPAVESTARARQSSTFKPSTLIEAPLAWDGTGLLPGESISKHRGRQPEPEVEAEAETQEVTPYPAEPGSTAADAVEEEEFVVEMAASGTEAAATPTVGAPWGESANVPEETDIFEETTETAPKAHQDEVASEPGPDVTADHPSDATGTSEPEADADASHHVDPLPPSGFRLFGLGGKKKKTDESAPEPPKEEERPAVATVSAFAPGKGLVEEEVIEEAEFDTPRHHHHKAEEHEFEDFEVEEKLQTQIRSGELGEMLQEAHLDHRIQLNFDDKNGEEEGEEVLEEEDEGDEPAVAEGQPAGDAQARRDRGSRGRRGRSSVPGGHGNRRGPSRRSAQTSDLPIISDLLKPGQEILVQIAKEPIAKKGARITSHIALPGRFLVYMPTVSQIGVSRKIASDEERQRLKRILVHERGEASGGFIVRTAAEGASEENLRADLRFLIHLWSEIKERSDSSKSPALIYHDLSLIERILRDQVSANFSSIWVDSEADYERIVRFLNRFSPTLVRRVKLYTKETPLFEQFGIQDEISKALRSKVWLKSGGSIVINQTEALVAIDINTGKYVGKTARLEDTIVKTNLDAIPEIVRQIRLRDLGGIIIIDFIDMDERKNRFKVMAALEEALKNDRAPTKVLQFNDFGLVAITRKRVKQSLERTLSVPCPTCQATGMVKSPTTVCNEIYTELRKMKKHFEGEDVLLRVHPETVKVLKANNASWLTEFEELVGKNILVKSDATLHPEQFDIQG
jgi:ribonuclease G